MLNAVKCSLNYVVCAIGLSVKDNNAFDEAKQIWLNLPGKILNETCYLCFYEVFEMKVTLDLSDEVPQIPTGKIKPSKDFPSDKHSSFNKLLPSKAFFVDCCVDAETKSN